MNVISNNDVYADALSTGMIATIPFITIGILGHPIVLYISASLGILLLCTFLIRFTVTLRKDNAVRSETWITELVSELSLPYMFSLSSLILIDNGLDASAGLWFSLAITIVAVACIPLTRKRLKENQD